MPNWRVSGWNHNWSQCADKIVIPGYRPYGVTCIFCQWQSSERGPVQLSHHLFAVEWCVFWRLVYICGEGGWDMGYDELLVKRNQQSWGVLLYDLGDLSIKVLLIPNLVFLTFLLGFRVCIFNVCFVWWPPA
jgi:hypothetical protein